MASPTPAPPEPISAVVDGGVLRGTVWSAQSAKTIPPQGCSCFHTSVLALHDLTANSLWWGHVAAALDGRVTLVAPDLRGRAGSAGLPGPWGLDQHAADALAFLDAALGADARPAVIVGHGFGALVGAALAQQHPDRVAAIVVAPLIAASVETSAPQGGDSLHSSGARVLLDPTAARLDRVYPDRHSYLAAWQSLPSFAGGLDRLTRTALMADLLGSGFGWRVAVDLAAVDHDVREAATLAGSGPAAVPTQTLRPSDVVRTEGQPTVDHLTLVLSRAGAAAVADLVLVISAPPDFLEHGHVGANHP